MTSLDLSGLGPGARSGTGVPSSLPRLLAGVAADGPHLVRHLDRWGPLPHGSRRDTIESIDAAGLRGRGGAWFPTAVKWRAVGGARLRRPVVVVNGAEAEPASAKDRLLLEHAPHLVLDGAAVAASAVGAGAVVAYVPAHLVAPVSAAIEQRRGRGIDPVEVQVTAAHPSFVAGEESAVVDHINGGPGGRPRFTALQPVYRRGVAGRPTLVQNAETLANAALIVRFGPAWFRDIGTERSPGTALVTLVTPPERPLVIEVALGATLASVLEGAGHPVSEFSGVLTGGYGGTWLPLPAHADVRLCEEGLRGVDATFGAGVLALLPVDSCPLVEAALLTEYLAGQSAGQCGPCLFGLPALAAVMSRLAWDPRGQRGLLARVDQLGGQVEGRGACHHPDGTVRMVRSALKAFAPHVEQHLRRGPCQSREGRTAPMWSPS